MMVDLWKPKPKGKNRNRNSLREEARRQAGRAGEGEEGIALVVVAGCRLVIIY
jgi:hypothetical protein